MASIDDIGLDIEIDTGKEVSVSEEPKSHEDENSAGVRENDSLVEDSQAPTKEASPPLAEAKPDDSSSDEDFDLTAPVGGSIAAKTAEDDDDEFDFEIRKKETPEIKIEITEAVSDEEKTAPDEETASPPAPKDENVDDKPQDIVAAPQPDVVQSEAPEPTVPVDAATAEPSSIPDVAVGSSAPTIVAVVGPPFVQGDAKAENDDVIDSSNTIQWKKAQEEWDTVKDVRLESDDDEGEERITTSSPMMTSQEAFNFLANGENVLSLYGAQIVTTVPRSGFQAFIHALFGPPRLKRYLIRERDVIFSMALHPYDSQNDIHVRMLLTVYKSLTGDNLDCPKFGNHWDTIGFQGTDPGTDFRGTGMLGLLCLLHLTCVKPSVGNTGDGGKDEASSSRHNLSLLLHRLSRDTEQNFPLALMSINWTRLLLQTLREGHLNKVINAVSASQGLQFGQAFLELHSAVAFRFYSIWQRGHKTILDSGTVLHDLEEALRRNAGNLMKEWVAHFSQEDGPAASGVSHGGKSKQRADRYAVGATSAPDEGVAELSMLN